jgi:MFS family permease
LGGLLAFYAAANPSQGIPFFIIAVLIGGMVMPLYALCGAHVNDYLSPIQMVAASGTLVLVNAIGATMGSPIAAVAMDVFGPSAFYSTMAATMMIVVAFTLWRSTRRADHTVEERGDFVAMTSTPLSASLTPDVEMDIIEEAATEEREDIQTSFEELVTELAQPDDKH